MNDNINMDSTAGSMNDNINMDNINIQQDSTTAQYNSRVSE